MSGLRRWQQRCQPVISAAILASFFFAAWWLRLLPDLAEPYVLGFLLAVPMIIAIIAWLAAGLPGFSTLLQDNRRWWVAIALLLILWAWWSPAWSLRTARAENGAFQLTLNLIFAVVVMCAAPAPKRIAQALLIGALFQAVIVIGQVVLQRPVGLQVLGEFSIRPNERGLSLLFAGTERLMRPYGLTVHPNVIGGYLAIGMLAITGWLSSKQLKWGGFLLYLLAGAVIWWALLVTFSRAALSGLLFGGLVLMVAWWRGTGTARPLWKLLIPAYVVFVIVGVVFVATYSEFVLARAGAGDEVTELRSVNDRRIFAQAALELIFQRPVTGIGMGNYVPWLARWLGNSPYRDLIAQNVHSLPLLITAEIGVPGFLMWAALLAFGTGIAWRLYRDPFAAGIGAGTAALFAIGLFDHYPWSIMHFQMLLFSCLAVAMNLKAQAPYERATVSTTT